MSSATDVSGGAAASTPQAGRTILDITGLARWIGPAVGILRVEQALATYALNQPSNIVLAYYDGAEFLAVNPRWAEHIVSWQGAVGRRRSVPLNLLPSPYSAVGLLERWHDASGSDRVSRVIETMQRVVLLARRRRRRGVVPFRLALGGPLDLSSRDMVLFAGSDWSNKDTTGIAALKRRLGFRYAVLCHDVIPLLFPQYFSAADAGAFQRYWTTTFGLADQILVTSQRVAADIAHYCAARGIRYSECRRIPVGCDIAGQGAGALLPQGLEADRFVLFVSTIEPRKNHALLLRVWARLLAENAPQRRGFKLVLVGRAGWHCDDVLNQLKDASRFAGTLVHLVGVSDEQLGALYRAAAFCVYPSRYEGFGLPIIEAFAYGKAVIAASGGALPETVGGLSPCLDPDDEDAWFATMKAWIEEPTLREQFEAKIRSDFVPRTWDSAAAEIFAALSERQAG